MFAVFFSFASSTMEEKEGSLPSVGICYGLFSSPDLICIPSIIDSSFPCLSEVESKIFKFFQGWYYLEHTGNFCLHVHIIFPMHSTCSLSCLMYKLISHRKTHFQRSSRVSSLQNCLNHSINRFHVILLTDIAGGLKCMKMFRMSSPFIFSFYLCASFLINFYRDMISCRIYHFIIIPYLV